MTAPDQPGREEHSAHQQDPGGNEPDGTSLRDLGPAAAAVSDVVRGVRDDQLAAPTPCPRYAVGDVLQHLDGLAEAFAMAARKETSPDGPGPSGDAALLPADWRERIPQRLTALAEAWRDPSAWTGPTAAGGVELDGATAGLVALDELVVHGWDLARGTGQDYAPDEASIAGARAFVALFSGPGTEDMRGDAFGPELAAPEGATPLEELLAMTGRDPRAPLPGAAPR
ncbi:TIGR03086 family metal-binding protein [Ornithinimicrobium cavernae]|uniref:TIGR03086 family metal-binding protein n=1 Tax=Ornithinimicrobium cavernae TaxID=2666047 RepID=UPI000D688FD6|nr:TIGR03086 family metal-binding protein [Ornithinimicrobium cavernae]